jgi:hypothetical protein
MSNKVNHKGVFIFKIKREGDEKLGYPKTDIELLNITIACSDCCNGISFEQEGLAVNTLSESVTKVEVESTLELDYIIGVDDEKIISTK